MVWLYVGALILVLGLVAKIVHWWNLPKVAEARAKKAADAQKSRTDRQENKIAAKESKRTERLNRRKNK